MPTLQGRVRYGTVCDMATNPPGTIARQHREALGLSRETLARRADVSTSMVLRLERDDSIPNGPALLRIAAALGIDPREFADTEPAAS